MVTSATVKGDSSTVQSVLSSYKNCISTLDDFTVWKGKSHDTFMQQAEKFVSEFISPMEKQLSLFATSLDNVEKYKKLKDKLSTAQTNYNKAVNDENETSQAKYRSEIRSLESDIKEMKKTIKEEISEVASMKIETNSPEEFKIKDFHLNPFIYFKQGNYGQAYAGGTIANSGCGPTSAAMVLSYILGEEITPPEVCEYSTKHGYACNGNGTYEALFPAIASSYGLSCQKESQTATNIVNSLNQGNLIIAHMGPGEFTSGGHYIVLREVDSNGNVLVADPANPARNKWYPASIFQQQAGGSMYSINT